MRLYSIISVFLAVCTQTVIANVEKTIFIAPSALTIPLDHPTFENLHLQTLSPEHSTIRTQLHSEFPSDALPRGPASWFILSDLTEGQRYEVRICWPATKPTSFHLETYEVADVFKNPRLTMSLAEYSETQQSKPESGGDSLKSAIRPATRTTDESLLLLSISTAADYYTTDVHLMKNPSPVFVDIILDPFILDVFPRSLVPTAGYITIVAIGSFFVARFMSRFLAGVAKTDVQKKDK
ncbi:hypothetical protein VC83_00830 [Pseudogymnoascus destructans]|uniref:Uncharacterized protein n=2 Tax=Pseudogymnoascus destructans TaxID=655981 RepID=L8FQI6_PSED2|nr:uncharacterized protein VC83_00830 [Pseudogymnoascus destructans]ELR02733.1 hypothetical protein GMDG_05679 [Pseudogymnoascus destructans 20631-21]OAF62721.1 hypothetical protein VC83_00830 [Pseudogymnoascus destructans]